MKFNQNKAIETMIERDHTHVEGNIGSFSTSVDLKEGHGVGSVCGQDPATWVLYLLECQHDTYYCGITNNIESRFQAHQSGKGAKYTRANPPLRIVATMPFPDRSSASRAEYQLKQQKKSNKIAWVNQQAELNAQKVKVNQLSI